MRRVLIESPFAGAIERNLDYMRECLADSFRRGEAPFAPHGLFTQPGVLNDSDPIQRARGMMAGFVWGEVAEATVVYTDLGVSDGMIEGIVRAKLVGRPVEYRSLRRKE